MPFAVLKLNCLIFTLPIVEVESNTLFGVNTSNSVPFLSSILISAVGLTVGFAGSNLIMESLV